MEKKIIITFRWWNEEMKEIPAIYQTSLEEHAEEKIAEMRIEGYTSGELCANVLHKDFKGYWEVTTETVN